MNVEQKVEAIMTEESWLVFKLMKQNFAVNCNDVIGILRVEDQLAQMAGYSSYVRGVMDFRGTTLPLLELRSVLGMISFEEQNKEFGTMIEARIDDHKNWVREFERCIQEGAEFKLAKDPHQCAFGKWYYSFETDNQALAFDLKKIEEPHVKLHELSLHISEYENISDEEEKAIKKQEVLQKAEGEYLPKVVEILANLEEDFEVAYREMCVVISNDEGKMLGMLVDEVSVVDELVAVDSQGLFNRAFSNSCIKNTARTQNVTGEIFVLDRNDLFGRLA